MKLLIDIPNNDYKHIKEYYEKNDIVEATYSYIYYGIPQKVGHWIKLKSKNGIYVKPAECSICGMQFFNDGKDNYCRSCGAKMESEK